MSYKAVCPVLSQADAEELGKWLALYEVKISGLTVWQILPDGTRKRDSATAAVVQHAVANTAGNAVASGPIGAAAAAAGCSIVLTPAVLIAMLAAVPLLYKAMHTLHKRTPNIDGPQPVATELEFGLTGVSDKRLKWSEYLLAIYAGKHQWQLTGLVHPEQLAAGSRAAGYPVPWSQQPRQPARRSAKVAARPASHKSPPRRSWRDWLDTL